MLIIRRLFHRFPIQFLQGGKTDPQGLIHLNTTQLSNSQVSNRNI